VYLLGLGLVLALGGAAVLCWADEPKKDADTKNLTAEEKDRALEEIALAYQIAAAGRKAGSPEALLGAAKLLSKLNAREIGLVKLEGVKPVKRKASDKDNSAAPLKEDGGKPTSFGAEIKKLKEDARKLNTPRDEKLAALIDAVDEKGRGSMNGPKWMGPFTLEAYGSPGYPHDFTFTFRANEPARVLVKNNSGRDLHLIIWTEVECEGTRFLCDINGTSNLQFKWRPDATRKFHVVVENHDEEEAEFEIFKN
jgi:hypothetical protein